MVEVNAGSLVGQQAQVAFDRLHQLGLQVHVRLQRSDTHAPGTVLAVTPAGQVAPGSTVTVTVAIPPHHHHHGPGSD
jgi:beta-lactam-binding protein with PASTA domain